MISNVGAKLRLFPRVGGGGGPYPPPLMSSVADLSDRLVPVFLLQPPFLLGGEKVKL